MKCNNCINKFVLWGFSQGDCEKCHKNFTCGYTPCDKLCDKCSEKNNLCSMCGCSMETNDKNS